MESPWKVTAFPNEVQLIGLLSQSSCPEHFPAYIPYRTQIHVFNLFLIMMNWKKMQSTLSSPEKSSEFIKDHVDFMNLVKLDKYC